MATQKQTLIQLDGGHSIVLKGWGPSDVAHQLEETPPNDLLFLQDDEHGVNGLVIRPASVVALIRTDRQRKQDRL